MLYEFELTWRHNIRHSRYSLITENKTAKAPRCELSYNVDKSSPSLLYDFWKGIVDKYI